MGYTEHRGTRASSALKQYSWVAKDVGALTRSLCAALEIESEVTPRFSLKSLPGSMRNAREGRGFASARPADRRKANAFEDDPVNFLRVPGGAGPRL